VSAWRRPANVLGLAAVVAGSAVLNTVRLSQNGYANIFYSGAVRSMVDSWHNFLFVSFDPGGLVTVDKPPLALWAQALSARIFGFSPLSVLLPEAIMGVAAVAVLYLLLLRRFGLPAAVAGAAALAVYPSFVAVSRANGVDPLLILLMVLASAAAVSACESGRLRTLILAGVLVGLAFNTKTLAAYLIVPAIGFGYIVCAPGTILRRIVQLLVAGIAMLVVSFAWIAMVELTPASQRPYVGGSTNNTELGLTFEYNGFGRVEGQAGGPGQIVPKPGAAVPIARQRAVERAFNAAHPHAKAVTPVVYPPAPPSNRAATPVPFGGSPGPLRLFGKGLGDQGGWYLPFAFFGMLAALAMIALEARPEEGKPDLPDPAPGSEAVTAEWQTPAAGERDDGDAQTAPARRRIPRRSRPRPGRPRYEALRGRRDPRLAFTLVFGGWFFTEAVVLSLSKGIVHPYYISALAPGTAAMVGAGVTALYRLSTARRGILGVGLAAAAVLGTVAAEAVQMHREHYHVPYVPVLIIAAVILLGALALIALLRSPRLAPGVGVALGAVLAVLLVVPTGYAASTWLAPVQSTFPAAGPTQAAGHGGIGLNKQDEALTLAVMRYIRSHGPTPRFELLTVASDTAAPFILLGMKAASAGGYSGDTPALTGPQLARLVEKHEARYVMLGGEYASRGGNLGIQATLAVCRELDPIEWQSPVHYPYGLVLFDCAGRERQLAAYR
jgi:4-amino-4-deoxy-L-arabinose transferase-like glycosyltransferase